MTNTDTDTTTAPRPVVAPLVHKTIGRTGGVHLFSTEAYAQLWVQHELNTQHAPGGDNYFVGFRDADPEAPFGIITGFAQWVADQPRRRAHVKDIFPHIVH